MLNSDLTGQCFERLLVIEPTRLNGRKDYWVCRCDCGNSTIVRGDHLRHGRTRSCRCLQAEASRQRLLERQTAIGTTHGASRSRAYQAWLGMRQRCNNPNSRFYSYYGGRGISVCERWSVFENFLADMGQPGPGESLDRYPDNNGNYEPTNCRWASRRAQQNNRRINRLVTLMGEEHTIAEWARITGIHRNTITQRIDAGLPAVDVLSSAKLNDPSGLSAGVLASAAVRKARTHCKRGHQWDDINTGRQKKGRRCRACHREAEAARRNHK